VGFFVWGDKMKYRISLPSQEELNQLFYYKDGQLISKYLSTNRKIGAVVGVKNKYGYLQAKFKDKIFYVHRLIWMLLKGDLNGMDVDHINGIKHDNRIENLRLVSRNENNQNLKKAKINSKTKLIGASFHKPSGKFIAQIAKNNKVFYLGLFDTAEDAHAAYIAKKKEIHLSCTI
jgi:hypothetical protein